MITVVGMGRKQGDLTADGLKAIECADVVVVKSKYTHAAQTVLQIRSDIVYCDDLAGSDDVASAIINRLQSYKNSEIAFCVVGEGCDDPVCQRLKNVRVVNGVSLYSSAVANN